jgi:acyl-CoA synthetase (AMP-forming)/AMP-acid ligase II
VATGLAQRGVAKGTGVAVLVTDSGLAALARTAAALDTAVRDFVRLPSELPTLPEPGMTAVDALAACNTPLPEPALDGADLLPIVYTSGTESSPKDTMLTHDAACPSGQRQRPRNGQQRRCRPLHFHFEGPDMKALQTCFSVATLFVGAAALQPVSAATLTFTSSGAFNASAPTTPFSAPGADWSVSFEVDSNPVPISGPIAVLPGSFTTVPFSSFSYQLGGVTVAPALYVVLYASSSFGALDLVFNDALGDTTLPFNALQFFGPQLYAGPETAPTLLPGIYPTFNSFGDGVKIAFNGGLYDQGNAVMSLVPAPPASLMLLAGLATLGALGARRRR